MPSWNDLTIYGKALVVAASAVLLLLGALIAWVLGRFA
jgi:hypothetical protein